MKESWEVTTGTLYKSGEHMLAVVLSSHEPGGRGEAVCIIDRADVAAEKDHERARLIAAAPDMLEALEQTRDDINLYLEWAKRNGRSNSELMRIGKGLDAVITKAKGEA